MKLNKEWHAANPMPVKAGLEQRFQMACAAPAGLWLPSNAIAAKAAGRSAGVGPVRPELPQQTTAAAT
jgi:hypothetical protein